MPLGKRHSLATNSQIATGDLAHETAKLLKVVPCIAISSSGIKKGQVDGVMIDHPGRSWVGKGMPWDP